MVRVLWFFLLMGVWSALTIGPGLLLKKRGHRQASGILVLLGFIGVAVLTALMYTAYVRGWRAPYDNFKRT